MDQYNGNGNGVNTKLAVLIEKIDNDYDNLMSKLNNNEHYLKTLCEETKDLQNKLKYTIWGILIGFSIMSGSLMTVLQDIKILFK